MNGYYEWFTCLPVSAWIFRMPWQRLLMWRQKLLPIWSRRHLSRFRSWRLKEGPAWLCFPSYQVRVAVDARLSQQFGCLWGHQGLAQFPCWSFVLLLSRWEWLGKSFDGWPTSLENCSGCCCHCSPQIPLNTQPKSKGPWKYDWNFCKATNTNNQGKLKIFARPCS